MSQDNEVGSIKGKEAKKESEFDVAIKAAFNDAVRNRKSEDQIKMAMIAAGSSFKKVTRQYNQFAVDAGLVVSAEEKSETVEKVCKVADKLETEESFNKAVADITSALKGVDEKSAGSLIRAWGRKNEVEYYKKPKGEGAGRSSFADKYYTYVTKPRTAEEAKAFVMGTNGNELTSGNVQNHLSHYMRIHKLSVDVRANRG